MSALGRKHQHQEPRRQAKSGPIRGLVLSLPVAVVAWGIVIAVIYTLATNMPQGWIA